MTETANKTPKHASEITEEATAAKDTKPATPETPQAAPATVAMIPLAKLRPAKSNVRKGPYPNIDSLANSITASGVHQSLKVEQQDDHFYVTMGSRRYAALQLLLERGDITPDYEVPCIIEGDQVVSLEERQLVENVERYALNPVDEFEAFADIIEQEKATPADLAVRFSTTERHIKQRLRLGRLAEPIREALRANEITLDLAAAFATTPNQERQLDTFTVLKERGEWWLTAQRVKQAITEASYKADDSLAVFVGVDAYTSNGGTVEEDLFTEVSRLTDAPRLEAMALAKLQSIADVIRENEQWGWAKGTLDGVNAHASTDIRINSYTRQFSEEEQNEHAAVVEKLSSFDGIAEEDIDRDTYDSLCDQLEALEKACTTYNAAEKAIAGVWVGLDRDGNPYISRGWVRADDIKRLEVLRGTGEEKTEKTDKAKEAVSVKPLSGPIMDDLSAIRVMAVRLALIQNPQYANDFALYTLARTSERETQWPISMHYNPATVHDSGKLKLAAHEPISKACLDLNRTWCGKEFFDGFQAFCKLTDAEKAAWAAYAMQRQLTGGGFDYKRPTELDKLASFLKVDIRDTFTPDESYFSRYTKPQLLQVADELGGKKLVDDLSGLKKGELVTAIAGLFDGSTTVYSDKPVEKAKSWLPKGMAFPAPKTAKKTPPKGSRKQTGRKAAGTSGKRSTKVAAKARTAAKSATAASKTKSPAAKAAA